MGARLALVELVGGQRALPLGDDGIDMPGLQPGGQDLLDEQLLKERGIRATQQFTTHLFELVVDGFVHEEVRARDELDPGLNGVLAKIAVALADLRVVVQRLLQVSQD